MENKSAKAGQNEEIPVKIAVSGKGGVGKTLIAGGLACAFVDKGLMTMAIDADSSPNLALTLGLSRDEARKIVPISENRGLIESKTGTGYSGVFRLSFTVDDIVSHYSVKTPFGVNLIVMGSVKSMGSGCTCAANAVVRALLQHLVVERDEAVVLDMEAGVEHIGRGTAKHVDTMLIVADVNMKSLEVAKTVHDLAANADIRTIFLVGNKVGNAFQRETISDFAEKNGLEILDYVPFDQKIMEADMRGETPIGQKDSEAVIAIGKMCDKLMAENI